MSIFEKNMDYLMHHRDTVLKTDKAKQHFDSIMKDLKTDHFNWEAGQKQYGPVPGRCRKGFKKNKQTKMCEPNESKIPKKPKVPQSKKSNKLISECKGLPIDICNKKVDCTYVLGKKKKYCRKKTTKTDVEELSLIHI